MFYITIAVTFLCHWTLSLHFWMGFPGEESACSAGDLGLMAGGEDPLEKRMATHSSILAWQTPWTEEPGGLESTGLQRIGHNRATNTHTHSKVDISFYGKYMKLISTTTPQDLHSKLN